MLLVWAPLTSLSLVGQEHGRTIPLADALDQPRNSNHSFWRRAASGLVTRGGHSSEWTAWFTTLPLCSWVSRNPELIA